MVMQKRNVQKTLAMLLAIAALAVWRQSCVWAQEEKAADDNKQTSTKTQKAADDSQQLTELEKLALQKQGYNAIGILSSGADAEIMPLDISDIYEGYTGKVTIGGATEGTGSNEGGIAIGKESRSKIWGIAMGYASNAGNQAVAIGYLANVNSGVAIGSYTKVLEASGIAIGVGTESHNNQGIAIGRKALTKADDSIALGAFSYVDKANTVSFGDVRSDKNKYRDVEGVKNLAMNGGLYFSDGNSPDDLKIGELRGVTSINGITFGENDKSIGGVVFNNGIITSTKVTGLTNADLSESSTEAVTGKQLFATNQNVTDLGTKVTTAENDITALKTKTTAISYADGTTTIGDITFKGNVLSNVASVNGAIITEKTFNSVSIDGNGISGFISGNIESGEDKAVTAKAVQDYVKDKVFGEADGDGIAALQQKTGGINRDTANEVTTIETNTKISKGGITTSKITVGNSSFENDSLTIDTVNKWTADDGITASKINGAIITSNSFNGVSIENKDNNIMVGGINLSALQEAGGIVTKNTEGISRADNVTTIEDNTKITQDGVETNNIDADKGTIGGVSFDGNGAISNVDTINGISFADGNINGVSIEKDNNNDVIVGGINLSDLQDGKIVSENTAGIERKDGNTTVIEGAAAFDKNGMNISKEKVESDGDGNTTTTTNSSKVTDGSISVSTQTVTKDKDGNETTVSNSVTLENGDIKLDKVDVNGNRETMYVGEEINNIKDDMREMGRSINKLGKEVDEVGALSAALAGLHPNPENANSRADLAMAIGSYDGEQAIAVGGFYRADKRTMFSVGASATSSKQMFNMGVSIALDKMPEAERREKEIKQAAVNNETLQAVVAALQELKADNEAMKADNAAMRYENDKMKARYEKLSADYEALKAKYEIQDVKAEEMVAKAKADTAKTGNKAEAKKQKQPAKRIVVIKNDTVK